MSNDIESPEFNFMTKIHEMTSNADKLIEIYIETLAVMKSIPPESDLPNKEEMIALTTLTVDTLVELKVAVTSLTEHSAEMNDAITDAVAKLESRTE